MKSATARKTSRFNGGSTVYLIPGDPVRNVRLPKMFDEAFLLRNVGGALGTMPHKAVTVGPMDEVAPTARIAGACNAILGRPDGTLLGDRFEGAGSAFAASMAAAGVAEPALHDSSGASAGAVASRLREPCPRMKVTTGSIDPAGVDIVANAMPPGMHDEDPLPFDIDRIAPGTFVGEVVMKSECTPPLQAAKAEARAVQVGTAMPFDMIPACPERFECGTTAPDEP